MKWWNRETKIYMFVEEYTPVYELDNVHRHRLLLGASKSSLVVILFRFSPN